MILDSEERKSTAVVRSPNKLLPMYTGQTDTDREQRCVTRGSSRFICSSRSLKKLALCELIFVVGLL